MCSVGMVDYQYQADLSDPVAKLRVAMDNMDGDSNADFLYNSPMLIERAVDAIQQYRMPEPTEDYTIPADLVLDPQLAQDASTPSPSTVQPSEPLSNLRLFPPPLFSRQGIPQNYKCVFYNDFKVIYLTQTDT